MTILKAELTFFPKDFKTIKNTEIFMRTYYVPGTGDTEVNNTVVILVLKLIDI